MAERVVADFLALLARIIGSRRATNILMSVSIGMSSLIILGLSLLALNPIGAPTVEWRPSVYSDTSSY